MNPLTEEEYKALPKSVQKLFKKTEDGYVLSDSDPSEGSALERALQRERDSNTVLKRDIAAANKRLKALEEEKANADNNDIKKKGDIEALEASWKKKLADAEAAFKAKEEAMTTRLRRATVEAEANRLAGELSEHPHLLLPHIVNALDMEVDEATDEVRIRVLGEDGKPTADTVEDFRKKVIANPKLAPLIKTSEASGGGAGGSKGSSGSAEKPLSEMTATEEAEFANKHPDRYKDLISQQSGATV